MKPCPIAAAILRNAARINRITRTVQLHQASNGRN